MDPELLADAEEEYAAIMREIATVERDDLLGRFEPEEVFEAEAHEGTEDRLFLEDHYES